jgi:type VI secretion system secreted protein VgrG
MKHKMNAMKLAIPLFVALAYGPAQVLAASILGSDLASFAVLGASGVTTANPSTIGGNVGSFPTNSITGTYNFTSGSLAAGALGAPAAQTQLDTAILALTTGTPGGIGIGPNLNGTFLQGVYNVGAGLLTGALILDGGGSNTAVWDFRFSSSLTTAQGSSVTVQNVGDGAGVGIYWAVATLATLDGDTFAGNVLASTITTDGNLTMGCGRLLAAEASVALNGVGSNISTGCGVAHDIGFGSGGFDQAGLAAVPEPETYAMMLAGLGLLGFAARRRKQKETATA